MVIEVFNLHHGMPVVWYHRDKLKSNRFCVYCGCDLHGAAESDKEHLVGRNFVPRGSLAAESFNFISRACGRCNGRKAAAERHVSTVSLFTAPLRVTDAEIDEIARRKAANDYHPEKKGTLVQDAWTESQVTAHFDLGTMRLNLVGPPQLSGDSVVLLAEYQVQGFFALVTSLDPRVPSGCRLLPREQIQILGVYCRNDWGNPQLLEVIRRSSSWETQVDVQTSSGWFKAMLRRSESDGWFWALEWNHSVRVVGSIFHPGRRAPLLDDLPALNWMPMSDGWRFRPETPLPEREDSLFGHWR